ncbi:GNAT family N-acetyltransferase [uncultured Umboniibacter sp.]|uniref:GNAT family N-acetyltransferase n=1 Tax=uncultured Umboniibacter sp. TaxID=1798917 RepID=UPI002604F6A5|nr:GNAT family N-acetyltransferase [uncultured Umboniibacter sp.]
MPNTQTKSAPQHQLIRQLKAEDISTVQRIAELAWRAHYPGIISHEQIDFMLGWMYSHDQLRSDMERGVQFAGAYKDEELVGFAGWELIDSQTAYLHKLYLLPNEIGAGIGSQMLSWIKREATEAGASQLKLAVNKANVKAIKAYERNGFSQLESVCNDIGNGFVMDDYIYGIALS